MLRTNYRTKTRGRVRANENSFSAGIDCLVREKHEWTKYKTKCIAKERTVQEIIEKKKSVKYEKLSTSGWINTTRQK